MLLCLLVRLFIRFVAAGSSKQNLGLDNYQQFKKKITPFQNFLRLISGLSFGIPWFWFFCWLSLEFLSCSFLVPINPSEQYALLKMYLRRFHFLISHLCIYIHIEKRFKHFFLWNFFMMLTAAYCSHFKTRNYRTSRFFPSRSLSHKLSLSLQHTHHEIQILPLSWLSNVFFFECKSTCMCVYMLFDLTPILFLFRHQTRCSNMEWGSFVVGVLLRFLRKCIICAHNVHAFVCFYLEIGISRMMIV